ncbi:MAG: DUF2325 domain-containing protein [Deltaproteobacteria bacterium]|nr:DUF2325 domain-containing protein [Deltaproteobacteria bacterium]
MSEIIPKKSFENLLTCETQQLKRIWEIQNNFKCPVIGSCLTIDEQRRILKKTGHKIKKMKSHEIHRAVMWHINDENPVSIKTERYLNHKYRKVISEFGSMEQESFFAQWKKGFRNGKMDGLFYMAAIRNDLPEELIEEIFGDTHMLCHANLEEVMKSRRALSMQENAAQKLARMLQQERGRAGGLKQNCAITAKALKNAEDRLQKIKKFQAVDKTCDEVLKLKTEKFQLKDEITSYKERDSKQNAAMQIMQSEKRYLKTELLNLQSTNQQLAEEVSGLISKLTSFVEKEDQCRDKCARYQLCSKRILIVGGITKIKHLYKQLVESSGGEFDYHDGYMNNGKINIEARVMRADLVICPVNCNSHTACERVKKLCRKFGRPVKMLSNSSLSSISDALLQGSALLN